MSAWRGVVSVNTVGGSNSPHRRQTLKMHIVGCAPKQYLHSGISGQQGVYSQAQGRTGCTRLGPQLFHPSLRGQTRNVNMENNVSTYRDLKVTILRAQNVKSMDYFSESDCYVTVNLPTASATIRQTKTVANRSSPEWNETFAFRIHTQVKNILELKLWDEDISWDDSISTILFDVSNLVDGTKETKVFTIQKRTELFVEFDLQESMEFPEGYRSNGILMAPPLYLLDVNIDETNSEKVMDMVMKIFGTFENNVKIEAGKLHFHINKDLATEITLNPASVSSSPVQEILAQQLVAMPSIVQGKAVRMSLPLLQDKVDLDLHAKHCLQTALDVRLELDIPKQEKDFLRKRKLVVGKALQKLFSLPSPTKARHVPVIALSASGGGSRAMTGLLGSLKGLQEIGLLDAVTYITGVSGATWCMSSLYQEDNWSQHKLDGAIEVINHQMLKGFFASLSDNMMSYRQEMQKKAQEGHLVSLIDLWGMALEHLIFGKRTNSTLSDQERAVEKGQNPLPIYTAVNMKKNIDGTKEEAEWCEFTPYEVGLGKYGAFTSAKKFGSQFFLGHLLKKLPEFPLSYLLGIWSSAMSVSYKQIWNYMTSTTPEVEQDVNMMEDTKEKSTINTHILNPLPNLSESMVNFFQSRPVVAETNNFMRGLFMHWNYRENRNFNACNESHPDAFPNRLTPADATMHLMDAGHSINTGFVPVLRPERGADVVISISNSWDLDNVLDVVRKTADYCTDHQIPFPSIDYDKAAAEPKKEVYIFQDENNPEAPIVIHFPLVNLTYQKYKAPGELRESEAELRAGQVDVSSNSSPYTTTNFSYSSEDFHALVDLTEYNILNNKAELLDAIHAALKKKMAQK